LSVFLAKRLIIFFATLLVASLLTFLALEVLPGDPAHVILGMDAPESAIIALRKELGLDQPAWQRYLVWITNLAQGKFANSYTYGVSIWELVRERLVITVPLAMMSMVIATAIALGLGVYAAANHNRGGDVGVMSISQLGIAVPNFWLALMLILLFAVELGWFKSGGFPGWEAGLWPAFKALILPSIALATVLAAILARFTRSSVLEVMREDFVRTARAKGLSRRATLWRHVMRNALIPVITIMGLQFANLLAGTIVVESVFAIPGIGRLVFQAIGNRDIVVVRDVVLLLAAIVISVNFIIDMLYAVIDPRLKVHDL